MYSKPLSLPLLESPRSIVNVLCIWNNEITIIVSSLGDWEFRFILISYFIHFLFISSFLLMTWEAQLFCSFIKHWYLPKFKTISQFIPGGVSVWLVCLRPVISCSSYASVLGSRDADWFITFRLLQVYPVVTDAVVMVQCAALLWRAAAEVEGWRCGWRDDRHRIMSQDAVKF